MKITETIANIQAQYILKKINELDCSKEAKEKILDDIIKDVKESIADNIERN